MMQAVRCHDFSAVEGEVDVPSSKTRKKFRPRQKPLRLRRVLSLDSVPIPTLLKPNQVLIRVKFAGIQYPDALQAQGLYQVRPKLPYIPGMDATGVVVKVGSAVAQIRTGDCVMATMLAQGGTGGMADYIVAPQHATYRIPPELTSNLAACSNIGRNYFAAYHSLKTIGKIGPGSLVLVDGASGGVGMATIELAKAMGAKVIAGVSVAEKVSFPRSVHADVVLTYGKTIKTFRSFKTQVRKACETLGHTQGVDLVVDMVQGDLFEAALLSCVRPLGTICLVGFTAGQKAIRPGLLLVKEVNVVGSLWGRWAFDHPGAHRENVKEILSFLASGAIVRRVDRIFDKKDFIKAFDLFEENQGRGNTVVSFVNNNTIVGGAHRPSKL